MSDYDYPPDEFDQPPAAGQSVGIHRAPQSKWSKVWPYLVVIIIFAALAYGVVSWFASQKPSSDTGSGPTSSSTQPAETTDPESPEATENSDEPSADEPSAEETSAEPEESETTPEPEPTEEETTAELNRAVDVRVLNATRRAGLAGSGVNTLSGAGWTNATAANYSGGAVSASVVWFKSEEHRADAEQIASDLGISNVSMEPTLVGPVSVILADDFSR